MADAAKKYEDFLSMPDEEFTNIVPPDDEEPVVETEESEEDTKETSDENPELETETTEETESEEDDKSSESTESENTEDDVDKVDESSEETESTEEVEKNDKTSDESTSEERTKEEEKSEVNYKEFYDKVMAPFKANGKSIDLRSPEEAVQLMQMGANYTKKMQAIQPYRKMLIMLENNGLMDENKLSYLIDLEQKNPDAIQKLIKDSKIDPMELDTEKESTYQVGNHQVSNEEAAFVTALDDLKSTQEGQETLQVINDKWDQASKEVLWENPELLNVIQSQRQNGIYDRIVSEFDRQTVLGKIPAGTSFINAYKAIGDQLGSSGAFNDLKSNNTLSQESTTNQEPVAKSVTKPKAKVKNNEKANAASSTRSSPKQAKKFVNPLAMSDDEFLKQMENRL